MKRIGKLYGLPVYTGKDAQRKLRRNRAIYVPSDDREKILRDNYANSKNEESAGTSLPLIESYLAIDSNGNVIDLELLKVGFFYDMLSSVPEGSVMTRHGEIKTIEELTAQAD